MNNQENVKILLNPNGFSFRQIRIPLFVSAGVFLAGTAAVVGFFALKVHKMPHSSLILGVLMVAASVFLLLKERYVYSTYIKIADGNFSLVKDKKNEVMYSVPLEDVKASAGYFHLVNRYFSGYPPVIKIEVPEQTPLVIGYQDYNNHYSWGDDDPWSKNFDYPTSFPSPQYIVSGDGFMALAKLLVDEPVLHRESNRA